MSGYFITDQKLFSTDDNVYGGSDLTCGNKCFDENKSWLHHRVMNIYETAVKISLQRYCKSVVLHVYEQMLVNLSFPKV